MGKPLINFAGKVVLVTGASTGIGRATALSFAEQEATVVIGDIDPRGQDTVKAIESGGGRALFVKTDVSRAADVENLVATAVKQFGKLDCAFNNSGVLPQTQALADLEEAEFDRVLAIDLKGVFLCLKYEILAMRASGGGAIVNTASVAGVIADPGISAYVAAKHGVIGLTKAAALDYATQGIRVNALAPGLVATPMTERWLKEPAIYAALMANSPIGRPAQPEEISGMVLFLCSDASSFTTGQVFLVDGGQTAH
jgi:NAD(P)-dependent dehydrogenase (short-subunit alcohol dehydrogenase family)